MQSDFRKIADTGDILLFKSPQFGSQVQRLVTNSNYNHVAIVLRCSKGQIRFIEAVLDTVLYSFFNFLGS